MKKKKPAAKKATMAKKPAAKSAAAAKKKTAVAKKASSPAPAAPAPRRSTYTPQPVQGIGPAPFRYPPQ